MHLQYFNVSHALMDLPGHIMESGVQENTRNGRVVTLQEPLILETTRPCERTIMIPDRKANALLFLLDGLSILSRVDNVKPFSDIAPRFTNYTDDGQTIRGHYGRRLWSQITPAISLLTSDPMGRRNTMSIWDPKEDQGAVSNDIPCNVHVNLRGVRRNGIDELDLIVFNRSNDLFWGMLGANIVQFSFLQEYLASVSGLAVGRLFQISTNAHIYLDFGPGKDPNFSHRLPQPMATPLDTFCLRSMLNDLFVVLSEENGWQKLTSEMFTGNTFIQRVVLPMIRAHYLNDPKVLDEYESCDWFVAMKISKGWELA